MTANNNIVLKGPSRTPRGGAKPKSLVVFLHGLGADGHDLISLADVFTDILPSAAYFSPHAPFAYDMAPPEFASGFQWFSLRELDAISLNEGILKAAPILEENIARTLKELGIPDEELILIGFSQGAMMALEVGLRRTVAPKAIIGFSGMLIGAERLKTEITCRPPVCLIHGEEDPVVPFNCLPQSSAALSALKVPVESHAIPDLGHGISDQALEYARDFLSKTTAS